MSELAEQDRSAKRNWARPGSSRDGLIRLAKIGLPALVGIILAFLALVPLENRRESSFLLDKNKVDRAGERLKVEAAQYRGQDETGRPFTLSARSAIQATSANPVVEIADMAARMRYDDGPAQLTAERARYNMDTDNVAVMGPIQFRAANGYQLQTRDVTIDLRGRSMRSQAPVDGRMPLGTFSADSMSVDLPQRNVVLNGRARLRIVQGAFRGQQ